MRRVVLDTNVYLSAILFGGPPETILHLARSRTLTLVVSRPILAEFTRVLRAKFAWTAAQARQAEMEIRSLAAVVRPRERLSVVTDDEPDNRVLECAVAGAAQAIVTGDLRHLRPLNSFRGIPILTPREFLHDLRPTP
ncbi:MAG: putative toxin-antitoxin system toxin component, PIN family [Gemmatimonadales bacterium]|nr:putative toxin-antitoxin system toxin component, PIN family [Gemmatimonadales bacterium]